MEKVTKGLLQDMCRVIFLDLEDLKLAVSEIMLTDIRSSGLWACCDINNIDAFNLLDKCYESGLILVTAGNKSLRFAPALNISEDEIREGIDRFGKALI